jgi:hypothetical protein
MTGTPAGQHAYEAVGSAVADQRTFGIQDADGSAFYQERDMASSWSRKALPISAGVPMTIRQ